MPLARVLWHLSFVREVILTDGSWRRGNYEGAAATEVPLPCREGLGEGFVTFGTFAPIKNNRSYVCIV